MAGAEQPLLDGDAKVEAVPVVGKEEWQIVHDHMSAAGLHYTKDWGEKYEPVVTSYEGLFMKKQNKLFGDHFERACRGAVFLVLFSLPIIFNPDFQNSKVYTPGSIIFYLFALYLTSGDSINFALGGIEGTALAGLNIWIMNGLMPDGYLGISASKWWVGAVMGGASMVSVLWLNLSINTKVFHLSTFVWYFMDFMNPDAIKSGYSSGFALRWDGAETLALIVAIFGSGLGVLAAYVPFPVNAKDEAMAASKTVVNHLQMTKRDILKFYSAKEFDPMLLGILQGELSKLRDGLLNVPSLLASSWWETFGMTVGPLRKGQMQREYCALIQMYLSRNVDLLATMLDACQGEDFNKEHDDLMDSLKVHMDNVVVGNGKVLKVCVAIMYNGGPDDALSNEGHKCVKEAKHAVEALTQAFTQKRKQGKDGGLEQSMAGEHVFVTTFCLTQKYTSDILEAMAPKDGVLKPNVRDGLVHHFVNNKGKDELTGKMILGGFTGAFDRTVLFEPSHLSWTLRNSISILIAFFLGCNGWGTFLKPNDAGIASTCGVLLSTYIGSAIVKNLGRMQGVVMGLVFGNIVYSVLGACAIKSQLMLTVVLFFTTWGGLFIYFHSTTFAGVGLLVVVFGVKAMLKPCASDEADVEGVVDPTGSFGQIVDCTMGIFIMTLVDSILVRKGASHMALDSVKNAAAEMRAAVDNLLDPDQIELEFRSGTGKDLNGAIAAAKSLGSEAELEPRYWRHDWPSGMFNMSITYLTTVRHCLRTIEENVLSVSDGKRKKNKDFLAFLSMPSCIALRKILDTHMNEVLRKVGDALHDDANRDPYAKTEEVKKIAELTKSWQEPMKVFIKEVNEKLNSSDAWTPSIPTGWGGLEETKKHEEDDKPQTQKSLKSMTDDPVADVAILSEAFRAMFEALDNLLCAAVAQ